MPYIKKGMNLAPKELPAIFTDLLLTNFEFTLIYK